MEDSLQDPAHLPYDAIMALGMVGSLRSSRPLKSEKRAGPFGFVEGMASEIVEDAVVKAALVLEKVRRANGEKKRQKDRAREEVEKGQKEEKERKRSKSSHFVLFKERKGNFFSFVCIRTGKRKNKERRETKTSSSLFLFCSDKQLVSQIIIAIRPFPRYDEMRSTALWGKLSCPVLYLCVCVTTYTFFHSRLVVFFSCFVFLDNLCFLRYFFF